MNKYLYEEEPWYFYVGSISVLIGYIGICTMMTLAIYKEEEDEIDETKDWFLKGFMGLLIINSFLGLLIDMLWTFILNSILYFIGTLLYYQFIKWHQKNLKEL